ncbi:MHYT domain-containing protein [Stutzerimonas stutzeri]
MGWVQHAWLCAAAVCMGGSIWSMHFVGMLVFGMRPSRSSSTRSA